MCGQPDKDVDLADIHELAEKIIVQKRFFRQFSLRAQG
jgi:hypothetical protein